MIKNCQQCTKEFKTYPCKIKIGRGKFCSYQCFTKSRVGKPISDETREKIKRNNGRYWLGKKQPIEAVEKARVAKLGKRYSPKTEFKKGLVPWNKGIKTHVNPWKSRTPKPLSLEHRVKISVANKGKVRSEETRQKMRTYRLDHPNRVYRNTSIERRMEGLLVLLGVEYQKQVALHNIACVDFYIPSKKLVIQCDGCYWHGCPEHKPTRGFVRERDARQDKELEKMGLTVIRFWEHEINALNFNIQHVI